MSAHLRVQLSVARDFLFPRRCIRKKRWRSERMAKAVIRTRLGANLYKPTELYCYACAECDGWHITKMKQPD